MHTLYVLLFVSCLSSLVYMYSKLTSFLILLPINFEIIKFYMLSKSTFFDETEEKNLYIIFFLIYFLRFEQMVMPGQFLCNENIFLITRIFRMENSKMCLLNFTGTSQIANRYIFQLFSERKLSSYYFILSNKVKN